MRASDAAHKAAWTLTKIRPTTAPGATFRKPQSAPVKRRRKMRDAGEGTIGDLIAEFGCAPTTSEIREALDRWRRARRDSETVRVMFGSGLYEVEFCGNERATRHRDPLSDSF